VESNKYAARQRERWLLVTNLAGGSQGAKQAVKSFRRRMQIEEGFRDLISPRHGFALRESLGRRLERIANLLFIAALGVLATWLMGLLGYARNLQRGLQASSERRCRVMSVFFVGRQLLTKTIAVAGKELRHAKRLFHEDILAQVPA